MLELIAQTSAPAATQPSAGDFFSSGPFMIGLGLIVFMLFMSSSRKKQERAKEAEKKGLLDNLKRGDKVQTIGGILGNVVEVRDDEVVVKVDETTNAKIKFSRSAIHKVITGDDKAEVK